MAEPDTTTTSGRERPILFSGPMVRAILAGTKTQTRRLLKRQPKGRLGPWDDASEPGDVYMDGRVPVMCVESRGRNKRDAGELSLRPVECPYGVPGDRLWVRETWCLAHNDYHDEAEGLRLGRPLRDDGRWCHYAGSDEVELNDGRSPWKPSIHMPRWASRLTLEVTDVRVQRLQDMTHLDLLDEGAHDYVRPWPEWVDETAMLARFTALWDSINARRAPWGSNPWVWCVSFVRSSPLQKEPVMP